MEHEDQVIALFRNVYKCFMEKDADLIEINPLVLTDKNIVVAADSKVTIDDNAAFRQKDLKAQEDKSQMNDKEMIAS